MKTTTRKERRWWRSFVFRFWVIAPMIVLAIGGIAGPVFEAMGYEEMNWIWSPIVVVLMFAMITIGVVWLLFTALTRPEDPDDRRELENGRGSEQAKPQ